QKGIRSMEIKRFGLGLDGNDLWLAETQTLRTATPGAERGRGEEEPVRVVKSRHLSEAPADTDEEHATQWPIPLQILREKLEKPCQGRPYYIRYAFKMGWTVDQVYQLTHIDPWFLENMKELVDFEEELIAGR